MPSLHCFASHFFCCLSVNWTRNSIIRIIASLYNALLPVISLCVFDFIFLKAIYFIIYLTFFQAIKKGTKKSGFSYGHENPDFFVSLDALSGHYLMVTFAPTSSRDFLRASASSLETPVLTIFGAESTSSFASFRPREVASRTTLMTLTF